MYYFGTSLASNISLISRLGSMPWRLSYYNTIALSHLVYSEWVYNSAAFQFTRSQIHRVFHTTQLSWHAKILGAFGSVPFGCPPIWMVGDTFQSWWRHQMGIHWSLPRTLMFYLICAWINRWVNNCEAGNLRRHHAHSDVIIMWNDTTKTLTILVLHADSSISPSTVKCNLDRGWNMCLMISNPDKARMYNPMRELSSIKNIYWCRKSVVSCCLTRMQYALKYTVVK